MIKWLNVRIVERKLKIKISVQNAEQKMKVSYVPHVIQN